MKLFLHKTALVAIVCTGLFYQNAHAQISFNINIIDTLIPTSGAKSIITIDLDGDTDLDIVGGDFNRGNIAWWEKTASGYDYHLIDPDFTGVEDVFIIDLDEDGDLDILGAAFYDDEVAWWENDGSENFTKHSVNNNYNGAYALHAADMDNDGDNDLVGIAFYDNIAIAWWENDGSENFTMIGIDSTVTNDPRFLMLIDLDEDGYVDILTNDSFFGDVSWMDNQHDGTFQGKYIGFGGAVEGTDIDAMDIDEDGDIDLVVAAEAENDVFFYENNGSETFTENSLAGGLFTKPFGVEIADLDGDLDFDILGTSNAAGGKDLVWWENDGSENFTQATLLDSFPNTYKLQVADMDADNDMDIVLGLGSTLQLLDNDGSESFSLTNLTPFVFNAFPDKLIVHDLDSDTDPDILGKRYWWKNIPPDFVVDTLFLDAMVNYYPIDVDSDGDEDVVSLQSRPNSFSTIPEVTWWENDGLENFTQHTIQSYYPDPSGLHAGDVDSDGDVDIFTTSKQQRDVTWWENDGSENFTEHVIDNFMPDPLGVTIVDFDSDGDIDILAYAGLDDPQSSVDIVRYSNDGSQNFQESSILLDFDGINNFWPLDMDGDGDVDFLAATDDVPCTPFTDCPEVDEIVWFENDGTQSYTKHVIAADYSGVSLVFPVDIDADGDVDVLGGNNDENAIWENDGNMFFTKTIISQQVSSRNFYVADMNADGLPDIVAEPYFSDTLLIIWENDTEATCTHLTSPVHKEEGVDIEADLTWAPSAPFPLGYKLTVGTSSGSGDILDDFDVGNVTTYDPGTFPAFTDIFVKITPYSASGNVMGCLEEFFTTGSDCDPVFVDSLVTGSFDGAVSLDAIDIDGDFDIDIVAMAAINDELAWFENDGMGNFTEHTVEPNLLDVADVTAGDVDHDGDIDFVGSMGIGSTDDLAWWENDGSQNFTKHIIEAGYTRPSSLNLIDLDEDGDEDIVAVDGFIDRIAWWENDGSENFTEHTIRFGYSSAKSVSPIDLDFDGDLDLIATAQSDDLSWFENDGSENFTKRNIDLSIDRPYWAVGEDMDADGDWDIVVAAFDGDEVVWYENNGSQSFTKKNIDNNYDGALCVLPYDMDSDGDVDVVGINWVGGHLAYWENDGSENFTKDTLADFPNGQDMVLADFGYNGALDIVAGSFTTDTINVWFNSCEGSPPPPPLCTNLINPMDGDTLVDIGVNLVWMSSFSAEGYELSIGTSPGGTDILNNADVGDVTLYDPPSDLPLNDTIYVTIIPYNALGNATGCLEESFTTESAVSPPSCTGLGSPMHGTTGLLVETAISWDSIPDADGYRVDMGTSPGATNILDDLDFGADTSYIPPPPMFLPYDSTIYITITPYNSGGDATGCMEEYLSFDSCVLPNFYDWVSLSGSWTGWGNWTGAYVPYPCADVQIPTGDVTLFSGEDGKGATLEVFQGAILTIELGATLTIDNN